MKVLKFGGTSLANAKKFLQVANILEQNIKKEKIAVVLSAPAKITNYLVNSLENMQCKEKMLENIIHAENIFFKIIDELNILNAHFNYIKIKNAISIQFNQLRELINGIIILKQCPENIRAIIISRGEVLSVLIMKYILQTKEYRIKILDPVKNFISTGQYLDSTIDIYKSQNCIKKINTHEFDVILMSGFIAGNKKNELVLLGRNGSDYSSAVLAACLNASCCEIWTDVDGVFTSDPREVSDSYLLKEISYQEAMELSYFGAKILHPRTIQPLFKFQIPCFIKNTHNPEFTGTLICNSTDTEKNVLKGVTYLNQIVMLSISGKNSQKMLNVTARLFNIMSHKNIKIILITQSSCKCSINLCILEKEINTVEYILNEEFQLELKEKILNPIKFIKEISIISIIGSNIYKKYDIASKIFSVLGSAQINILAIAQGSSKYSISLVVNKKDTLNGVKIIHNVLFSKKKIITVLLIGVGGVGSTLIKQIINQKYILEKDNIKIKICLLANSKKILISEKGINIKNWDNDFKKSQKPFVLDEFIKSISKYNFINPVLIDCTSNQNLSEKYINFLDHGYHIVTSNKKANTNNYTYYKNIRKTMLKNNKKFFYETNVGAGLPVISMLQNLLKTGDNIIRLTGILSGSLSFIFGKLDEGYLLSEATKEAKALGFTEPHPYDDLSGIDVARKLLILAREIGYKIELKDINIEPILPKNFIKYKNVDDFLVKLQTIDQQFTEKVNQAHNTGKVLRFVGTIKNGGESIVKIQAVDNNNPLYTVKNGENVLAFYSKNYQPIPLVLRGYGAGNDVTASGVFSDLLRTLS